MLTINVIGKNCNVKIDEILYTVVVDENFDLKKLQNWGIKYYYNLNQSKEYFDELGEHQTREKRSKFKSNADAFKQRIKFLVTSAIESRKKEKIKKDYNIRIEKKKLEQEKKELLNKENEKFYVFKQLKDFTVKDNKVYLKDLNFELPQLFLDVILKEYNNSNSEETIQPYIRFMYRVASNPYKNVRDNIFIWIHSNGFKITENGYIYGVRWVVKKSKISELTQFVHSEYTKKKLQKKSPKNYFVYEKLGDYKIVISDKLPTEDNVYWNKIGNLYDLFNKKEELEFTDNHTKSFSIKLGKIVSMNRMDCDSSGKLCSSGLHFVDTNFAKKNVFGDTLIGILVDPINIISIPDDSYPKIRCCEYYPLHILDESVLDEMKLSECIVNDMDYEKLNLSKLLEDLEGKTNLFEQKDKLKEIKNKLNSFKVVKPDEPEQLAVTNRTIKL